MPDPLTPGDRARTNGGRVAHVVERVESYRPENWHRDVNRYYARCGDRLWEPKRAPDDLRDCPRCVGVGRA